MSTATSTELRTDEEALAAAKRRPKPRAMPPSCARRSRRGAQRDRSHPRDHADRARQHERDGVMLFARTCAGSSSIGSSWTSSSSRRIRGPGCPPMTSCVSRRGAGISRNPGSGEQKQRRSEGSLSCAPRPLRAPHRERQVHRVHLQAASKTASARALSRHHRIEGPRGSACASKEGAEAPAPKLKKPEWGCRPGATT